MSKERYFLEAYIPANILPEIEMRRSNNSQDEKHLHITLVRPFTTENNPELIKLIVADICKGREKIKYKLEGKDSFDEKFFYIPVVSNELLELDSELENKLDGIVNFDEKLNCKKILHLSVEENCGPITKNMEMSQLICIRDKKDGSGKRIWFGYDFETQEVISRDEILARKNIL